MTEEQLKNLIFKARGVAVESMIYYGASVSWAVPYESTHDFYVREDAWIKDLKRQASITGKALHFRRKGI